MNHEAMISAGYLPCMTKSTCITKVTKTITIPFTNFNTIDDAKFSMSDFDSSTSDESDSSGTSSGTSSDTSDDDTAKPRIKTRRVKYIHVANDISKYISNIKGI